MFDKGFERWEFECSCGCGYDTVDAELLAILEDVKEHYNGATTIISSGCRCPSHNAVVGGASKSQHLYARAVDFYVIGVECRDVYEYLLNKYPDRLGLGLHNREGFLHMDTRELPWRKIYN